MSNQAVETKPNIEVCDGNKAAAYGALLSRPDVVAVYPITPQSQVGEWLTRWKDEGKMDAEVVNVEGETSSMGVCTSASLTGGRVYTSTSSWGLLFMMDGLHYAAGYRIPVVMTNANRETPGIFTIGNSSQDMWAMRDTGWVIINVEYNQEILDAVIMAYRIAEDTEILLPVMVCYDGFYLSYRKDPLEVPFQDDVDTFLSPLKEKQRNIITPDDPLVFGVPPFFPKDQGEGCTESRYKHMAALSRVKEKLDAVDKDFENIFGRSYGGQIETYRSGTAKVVVDKLRDEGKPVGLIKVRLLRPFPKEKIAKALYGKKGIGVIDRSVCFGYDSGHLYMEVKAAIAFGGIPTDIPTINCIGGLANLDITVEQVEMAFDLTISASNGEAVKEITWLTLE
jgi:pyruvate/2-oxoacid:ferredoxin oxidoreductase alpha subunit